MHSHYHGGGTGRILWWSLWAAWNYKALAAAFAAAAITDEDYQQQLAELHQKAARRLMRVCLVNGEHLSHPHTAHE